MSSGHGARFRLGLWAFCAYGICAWMASVAYAEPRVVCVDPHDAELIARIRGQSRDLPLSLHFVTATLSDPPTNAELAEIASAQSADLLVHVQTRAGRTHVVFVYDTARRKLRTRESPPPRRNERFSRSAVAEAVALIVRGELSAALSEREDEAALARERSAAAAAAAAVGAGGASGATGASGSSANAPSSPVSAPRNAPREPKPQPPAKPTPPPAKPAPEAADAPEEADDEPPASVGGVGWLAPEGLAIAAGLRASLPGDGRLFLSPLLNFQLRLARLRVGLVGTTSLESSVSTRNLAVLLRRHSLGAELLGRFRLAARLELDLGAGGGVVLYQRASRSEDPSWTETDNRVTASAYASVLAELRWTLAGGFGISARVGVDVSLPALRFVYQLRDDPSVSGEVSRLRALEPWGTLCLFVDL